MKLKLVITILLILFCGFSVNAKEKKTTKKEETDNFLHYTMYIFYTNDWQSSKGIYRGTFYMDKTRSTMQLADNSQHIITQHNWQEGSFILQRNNQYDLTYSCGTWSDSTYQLRYTLAKNISGAYIEQPDTILKSNKMIIGPSHHSIFQNHIGRDWLMYHDCDRAHTERYSRLDRLYIKGNTMSSNGLTFVTQKVRL